MFSVPCRLLQWLRRKFLPQDFVESNSLNNLNADTFSVKYCINHENSYSHVHVGSLKYTDCIVDLYRLAEWLTDYDTPPTM